MSTRDQLLKEIDAFLRDTGMSPTAFGQEAANDRALMISLRKGRDLKSVTIDKIRAFIHRERAKREATKRRKSASAHEVAA